MERAWTLADSTASETGARRNLARFSLSEGKDLHPACLILYSWYSLSCHNGGADEIWPRWKKMHVLAYARGIYARSDSLLLGRLSSPLYGGGGRGLGVVGI
jgi:hypothetical protein